MRNVLGSFCYVNIFTPALAKDARTGHPLSGRVWEIKDKMTNERENEIRQMSRDEQEDLLSELRQKYGAQPVLPNQTAPMHNAKDLVAANEEIDLLETLLYSDEDE